MSMLPILLADDDKQEHLLIKLALQQLMIFNPLITVENGVELFNYLHNRRPFEDVEKFPKPGVVLLDLIMPLKGGLDALTEIKSDPVFSKIPVVIFTASAEENAMLTSLKSGADLFVIKPFHFEELVNILRGITERWLTH